MWQPEGVKSDREEETQKQWWQWKQEKREVGGNTGKDGEEREGVLNIQRHITNLAEVLYNLKHLKYMTAPWSVCYFSPPLLPLLHLQSQSAGLVMPVASAFWYVLGPVEPTGALTDSRKCLLWGEQWRKLLQTINVDFFCWFTLLMFVWSVKNMRTCCLEGQRLFPAVTKSCSCWCLLISLKPLKCASKHS